ncbi:MAG: hypothetical protein GJU72_08295 [Acidithiobacillus ferriphilus]|jgi:hypothetical protein|nr:hypothetical protein [Acidithiobacillus ferriphilus]MBW9249056.1 hypothetical protein [Acidithiobacillus ferriphilus]MBW9255385.1 hypothetical protein [Acidithiobacillus ferriphilus]
MAERPHYQAAQPPLASTLVRRDVEMRFMALARDLGLDGAENIRVLE